VLGVLLLGERLGRPRTIALALGLAGATIIVCNGIPLVNVTYAPHLVGDLLLVAHGAAWGIYTIAAKRLLDRHDPLAVSAASLAVALPCILPLAIVEAREFAWDRATLGPALGAAVLLGLVVSAGMTILWNMSLRHLDATRMAGFIFLQPLAGVVFAVVVLGEPVTVYALLGGTLVLAGATCSRSRNGCGSGQCAAHPDQSDGWQPSHDSDRARQFSPRPYVRRWWHFDCTRRRVRRTRGLCGAGSRWWWSRGLREPRMRLVRRIKMPMGTRPPGLVPRHRPRRGSRARAWGRALRLADLDAPCYADPAAAVERLALKGWRQGGMTPDAPANHTSPAGRYLAADVTYLRTLMGQMTPLDAVSAYDRALRAAPDFADAPRALVMIGFASLRIGLAPEADTAFRRALDREPHGRYARVAQLGRAAALRERRRWDEARTALAALADPVPAGSVARCSSSARRSRARPAGTTKRRRTTRASPPTVRRSTPCRRRRSPARNRWSLSAAAATRARSWRRRPRGSTSRRARIRCCGPASSPVRTAISSGRVPRSSRRSGSGSARASVRASGRGSHGSTRS
jgi:hypothetical protein